jgi:pSer/pThr/pTyr-binding forkhead associated (FHA) protein
MDFRLVMFREDGSRKDFRLSPGVTTIGRKEDCDIRIPLLEVSRQHAEIAIDEDGAVLRDLGASNGTHLNNQRITEEDLEPGDHIIIGPGVFTVQIDGEPSDEDLVQIRTKIRSKPAASEHQSRVGTSEHVYMSDEEADPIAELEALASSADQTAIKPDEEDEEEP